MKKYRVNVNGTDYEITLEEVTGSAAPAPAPAATSAPAAAPAPATAPVGNGQKIESPLTGTILSINVQNGDTVKKGQVLMILEAMKMENEIMAPCDGTITSVNVTKGTTVDAGVLLCVIG